MKAFYALLSWGVEAIVGLILVHFYFNKLIEWHYLRIVSLSRKHAINSLLDMYCYKLKTLELVKRMNLVLELTQENSIENSIQDSLPYILNPHSPC